MSASTVPTITAFASSPDRGRGLARDMRVRWALEEAGQAYDVRLLSFAEMKEPAHLAIQPFGQIPTYEDGEVVLFESGAILLHIAEKHARLMPSNAAARARAVSWLFAALNTVETPIIDLQNARIFEREQPWAQARLPLVIERLNKPLATLAAHLGGKEWLDSDFSVADLMMIGVLLRLKPSGLLDNFPAVRDYVARGEARPAFKRAFAAQLAVFEASQAAQANQEVKSATSAS